MRVRVYACVCACVRARLCVPTFYHHAEGDIWTFFLKQITKSAKHIVLIQEAEVGTISPNNVQTHFEHFWSGSNAPRSVRCAVLQPNKGTQSDKEPLKRVMEQPPVPSYVPLSSSAPLSSSSRKRSMVMKS